MIEELALYKSRLVCIDEYMGHYLLYDSEYNHIASLKNAKEIRWVGKLIQPRWYKYEYVSRWEDMCEVTSEKPPTCTP